MAAMTVYWIRQFSKGRLAIMPAPQIGDLGRAVISWKEDGLDIIVSLIERSELRDYVEAEKKLCEEIGLEFFWFPIRDGSVPTAAEPFDALVSKLADEIAKGRAVAIHCRAGIGRSSLLAAAVMNHLHIDAESALEMVAEARKVEVPQTEKQRQWILGYRSGQRLRLKG